MQPTYKPLSAPAQELRRLHLEAARRVIEWHLKRQTEQAAGESKR